MKLAIRGAGCWCLTTAAEWPTAGTCWIIKVALQGGGLFCFACHHAISATPMTLGCARSLLRWAGDVEVALDG